MRLGHCHAAAALPAAQSFLCRTDSNGFTFVVVSEFAYNSRSTVIRFLNEELLGAITGAFNGRRGRREVDVPLLFQHLHRDNVTDLVKCELIPTLGWGAGEEHLHCPHCPHHPACPGVRVKPTGEVGGQQSPPRPWTQLRET